MLARLCPGQDSLAGDLLEEHHHGRSLLWLWQQAVTAVFVSVARDLQAHPLLVARAVVAGWAGLFAFMLVAGTPLSRWSGGWLLDRLVAFRYEAIANGTDTLVMAWATHLHVVPAGCLGFLISGWIVTRLHRSHPAATLCAFTLSVLAVFLLAGNLLGGAADVRRLVIPLYAAFHTQAPIVGPVGMLLVPLLILLGGWYGTQRPTRTVTTIVAAGATIAGTIASLFTGTPLQAEARAQAQAHVQANTATQQQVRTGGDVRRRTPTASHIASPTASRTDSRTESHTDSRTSGQSPRDRQTTPTPTPTPPLERASRDCPQWRGPVRDGSACAFTAPKSWPDALTRRWKVDIGTGYATPLVVGSTVYAFVRRDDRELLLALDADTGRERWQTGYAAPYTPAPASGIHGAGPKATPLFHNGRIFTLGVSGIFSAFDATSGTLLWQKPADAEPAYFGTAVSPVGEGDLVIAHPGNYGPLTAFDARTGAIKWTTTDGGTFASPIVVELAGTRQVVSMTQKRIVGVSVAGGALLWQHPWVERGTPTAITPILYGRDTLIVGGPRVPITAITPARRADGTWSVDVAWEASEISVFMSNPVLIGDTLSGLSERAGGQFFALDAKTGKTLWLGTPREAANTAFVKAGNLLFLLNDDGELIVARNSRTAFEPLKRYTVADSATWAQPAISGNRIFIKDTSSLALWTVD